MTNARQALVFLVCGGVVFGPAACFARQTQAASIAWVEMVGQGSNPAQTSVRAITGSSTCPSATVDGKPLTLHVREAGSDAFPVTTCEAFPGLGAKHVTVDGRTLALAPRKLRRIVVLGDTGCRLKGALVQKCNDPQAWPFPIVASHAAQKRPDLVIHVGDYYYRESPCPAGDAGCAGSPHGDAWPSWSKDLFEPVSPLLTAAPWIFVRGNHEQCGRGSDGWFRFLDAGPTPLDCGVSRTSAPFTVRLDGLNMHVMDSADTEDVTAPPDLVAMFSKQFDELGSSLNAAPGWILTHRPIWGIDPKANGRDSISNRTEQVASDTRSMPAIDMVLSGHVHMFTTLSYGPQRPVQLIVGNGGDNGNIARSGPPVREEAVDDLPAHIFEVQRYGYMVLDRKGKGWKGTVYGVDDSVMATCSFAGREASCKLSAK